MNSRSLLLTLLIVAFLFLGSAALFAFPGWLTAGGVALVAGLVIGLMIRGRENQYINEVSGSNQETTDSTMNFTPKLLDVALNEMREGLLVIDAEMRVVAYNQAARNLFSNVHEEIDSRRLTELTRNPAIYDAFLDAVHGKERGGVKMETFQEGRRIFDLRVVPLQSSAGEILGAVGVLFDITRLERLETVRQEFLSNVSHELRTPLTSIMALAETLEAGAISDANNNRRFLSIIQKNAARMQHLIDDILELSAIEAGNVSVNPESVPLRLLVEDILASLSTAAADRKIAVRNLIESHVHVFADPFRLMQMLTNLIDNAIKFNRDGGTVTITCERGDRDRICVTDTGEGIAGQHLDRLFERFYRVDRARSRDLGGTGLGLAIVKHLARAHGGEVAVSSRVGEGTQFTIDLPHSPAISIAELSASVAAAN
jgi:two-component system phosphate regulon sensor histidine kinase PhoR